MYERFTLLLCSALTGGKLRREDGQTTLEYGMVLAFVAVAIVGALTLLSGGVDAFIGKVNTAISALPGF